VYKKQSLKFEVALHDRESNSHAVKIGSAWRLAVAYTLRLTVSNRWASLTQKLNVKSLNVGALFMKLIRAKPPKIIVIIFQYH
jgi:hypothetical protein